MKPATRPDKTYLSDATFTGVFLVILLVVFGITGAFPELWQRILAAAVVAAVAAEALAARLRRNRKDGPRV